MAHVEGEPRHGSQLKPGCLCRLMRESSIQSRKVGEKNISPNSVRKVTEVCLPGAAMQVCMIPVEADIWSVKPTENATEVQGLD